MNDAAEEAVDQLCDAEVDAIMYACLLAVRYGGKDCAHEMYTRLSDRANMSGNNPQITTSAAAFDANNEKTVIEKLNRNGGGDT